MLIDSLTFYSYNSFNNNNNNKDCNFYAFVYKNESVNALEIIGLLRRKKLKAICIYNLKKKIKFLLFRDRWGGGGCREPRDFPLDSLSLLKCDIINARLHFRLEH